MADRHPFNPLLPQNLKKEKILNKIGVATQVSFFIQNKFSDEDMTWFRGIF